MNIIKIKEHAYVCLCTSWNQERASVQQQQLLLLINMLAFKQYDTIMKHFKSLVFMSR